MLSQYEHLALLADLRQARGVTLQQMAAACGLHGPSGRNSVRDWEQGRSIPQSHRRAKFLAYLVWVLKLYQQPAELQRLWDTLVERWN